MLPAQISITFRDQTTGKISDLLDDEAQPCAHSQNLLGYFAGALLNYKDEGVEFLPSIVFCGDIKEFLKSFPGSIFHEIGRGSLDVATGPKILKDCAPLSSSNWFVFIERMNQTEIRYGIFTYFRTPTAIPIHEAISIDPARFCVLIRKIGTNTIEIRGSKGSNLTLIFSTVRESPTSGSPVGDFARACCASIEDKQIQSDFCMYLTRLLDSALTSSHGTILLCIKDIELTNIEELRDAIMVEPTLDFQTAFIDFGKSSTADSILTLQRCEDLLQGFLRCDGIIIFDTHGRITAYRVFYRPTGPQPEGAAEVVGGARRRAFEGVRPLVGGKLAAALFRSQDGLTLHEGIAP